LISIILYGRNDAHGYNLHRRVALGLNCLAEVLSDPDDEILFVDYNTPDELPTLIEALADTLTDRCIQRLRVFRVPPAVHRRRFAEVTHLPIVEPVCRNVAARRSNPANRWLLSTNTDMILLPLTDPSLSDVCRELPDGNYGLPRFELPEWLWERLPRNDPVHAMDVLRRLGPGLHLDEPTLSDEWIRFDAPGDFQLFLRDDLFAIDGFDEEMVLGWHVDSNLARRLSIHRGPVDTLADRLAGYHCNHSRTPTIYHLDGAKIQNSIGRFYDSVDRAELPSQRGAWGLSETEIEEVDIRARTGSAIDEALVEAIPARGGAPVPSVVQESLLTITYDSGHVLAFVADSIAVSPLPATVVYLGANGVLREMLERFGERVAPDRALEVVAPVDDRSFVSSARTGDMFVVDFGLDRATASEAERGAHRDATAQFPAGLRTTLSRFEALVELERDRLRRGEHPRRFVLINSSTAFVDHYVLAQLDCSHATPHSGVRRATVRLKPHGDEESYRTQRGAARLVRWTARLDGGDARLAVRARVPVHVGELEEFDAFGEGWATPDLSSIWTQGTRSELRLELDQTPIGRHDFVLSFGRVAVPPDEWLSVALVVSGLEIARGRFPGGTRRVIWRCELPATAVAERNIDVVLQIAESTAWLDERRLGVHVDSFAIGRHGWLARWDERRARRLRRPG
jgi:hypothetical protein